MSRPDDYDELLARVCEGLASGDFVAVRRLLMRARAKASEPEERGSLTGFEIACDAVSDAEGARRRVLEIAGQTSDEELSGCGCSLSDVGQARSDRKLLELAELVFSASKLPAPHWVFLANHAVVFERLERWEEAADWFGRAAALAADEPDLHARRASCLRSAGDLDAARDAYVTYLAAKPDDAHEWISLAIIESDAGRYDDAQRAYWRAAGLEPDNLSLHHNWFITALRADRSELAEDACKRLNAIDPSDWRSGLAVANLLRRSGDATAGFRRAAEVFEREAAASDDSAAEERSRLEYIAGWALRIAEACQGAEFDAFASRLCRDWVLSEDILALLRKREAPAQAELAEYTVLVEAVEAAPKPPTFAYLLKYQVHADSPEQAAELAIAFERRCGAERARASKVEVLDENRAPRHRGPTWRAGTGHRFPIEEFGRD